MSTTRREFLQTALGSSFLLSAGLSVPSLLARTARAAAATGEGVLVVVQLSGGNDGLNTVIPLADDLYARNRAALGIPASQTLSVNAETGLHPRLTGFAKLLEQGRLAIVQGVGYPNPDRSHFRSMDIWHSAQPQVAVPTDGWLGRALEGGARDGGAMAAGNDVPALHLGGDELPLALASARRLVPSVESLANFRLRTENGALPAATLAELARPAAADAPLLDFLRRSTLASYASSQQVQTALAAETSPVEYPALGLARKLQNVAQLIDAGLGTRMYYVSLDGFDTHSNQAASHAALLGETGDSLAAFHEDLAHRGHGDRVTVLTFSEFGRRVQENASSGTDHGAAAPLFVSGGRVAAGVHGAHPSLSDLDDGDLKHHTDFRQVYASLLANVLGCDSTAVLGGHFEPTAVFRA